MHIRPIAAVLAAVPLLVGASEPLRLKPSSPWVIDYADNSCRLIRMFGEGDLKTKLVFESAGPDDMSMMVTGNRVPVDSRSSPESRFLPVQSGTTLGISAIAEGGTNATMWSHVALVRETKAEELSQAQRDEIKESRRRSAAGLRPLPIDPAKVREEKAARLQFSGAVTGIELRNRWNQPLILETDSLQQPIESFDECVRDLIRSWGVDPDVQDRIIQPAWAARPQRWFSSEDYPPQMLAQGAMSVISARLLIDASGRITNCTSLSHFKAPQFDQKVCDIFLKRGHYAPAELADGTKVPSYVIQTVVFQ